MKGEVSARIEDILKNIKRLKNFETIILQMVYKVCFG